MTAQNSPVMGKLYEQANQVANLSQGMLSSQSALNQALQQHNADEAALASVLASLKQAQPQAPIDVQSIVPAAAKMVQADPTGIQATVNDASTAATR